MGRLMSTLIALTAIAGTAQAAPLVLTNDDLDVISAAGAAPDAIADSTLLLGKGNGNGSGNIGNNNGNNNSGNNNGNNNNGNNNGNDNSGSNNGNNNTSSGNGNNNSTNNNGNNNGGSDAGKGASDPKGAPDKVLSVHAALRDMLEDIITFDDGSAAADVLRTEVKLRIYRARLAVAKAEDKTARAERLERKIDRLAAQHAEAAEAAERKRRNGVTRKDLDFVFFSGDDAPDPRKGLQRIVDRGFVLYGHDAAAFNRFSDRLRNVILD